MFYEHLTRVRTLGCLIAMMCLIAACGPGDASPAPDGGDLGPSNMVDAGFDADVEFTDFADGGRDSAPDQADAGDADAATPSSDAAAPDVGPDVGPNDALLQVDATTATLQTTFTANITGTLGGRLGEAELTDNAGSVEIDGEALPTFGYRMQEWAGFELTLVQSIAVREDALFPLWFYCSGDQLDGIYIEGTEGTPSTWFPASSGTCDLTMSATSNPVDLPALGLETPAADHDFEVTGDLTVSPGESGTFVAGDRTWQAFVFETIDCTTECGNSRWWELHALLWDRESRDLCFSIFYMYEDGRDSTAAYTICLPELRDLVGDRVVDVDWSR